MELSNFQIGNDLSIQEIAPSQFDIPRPGRSSGHCVGLVLQLIQFELGFQPHQLLHQFAVLESNAKRLFRSSSFGLLAKYYAEPVGLLLVKECNPLHIDSFVVLDTVRGRGVGRELITRFRHRHAEDPVTVSVHKHNVGAIGFYKKLGFELVTHPTDEKLFLGTIQPYCEN